MEAVLITGGLSIALNDRVFRGVCSKFHRSECLPETFFYLGRRKERKTNVIIEETIELNLICSFRQSVKNDQDSAQQEKTVIQLKTKHEERRQFYSKLKNGNAFVKVEKNARVFFDEISRKKRLFLGVFTQEKLKGQRKNLRKSYTDSMLKIFVTKVMMQNKLKIKTCDNLADVRLVVFFRL